MAAGCANPNVNPSQARANTGYVDFHADPPGDLYWEVSRIDDPQNPKVLFSELAPPEGGVLRLAFPPGHYRLRITFLNRVVKTPAETDVDVRDGKITPVRVQLTDAGAASVQTITQGSGSSARGRFRSSNRYGSDSSVMYSLAATPEAPIDYQPKERIAGH
jgi:hypothetical protein